MPPSWLKRPAKPKAPTGSMAPIAALRDADRRRAAAMSLQAGGGNQAAAAAFQYVTTLDDGASSSSEEALPPPPRAAFPAEQYVDGLDDAPAPAPPPAAAARPPGYATEDEVAGITGGGDDVDSSEDDSSEEETIDWANVVFGVQTKYARDLRVPDFYGGEQHASLKQDKFVRDVVHGGLYNEALRHKARGGLADVPVDTVTEAAFLANPLWTAAAMREVYGWSERDVRRYWKGDEASSKGAKVKYLDAEQRKKFAVIPGKTMTRPTGKRFDTKRHVSKAAGAGFAIYVMDGDGAFYSSGHRVGLFHHSSFLAGENVAGAGEMRVERGRLTAITNKSGHYMPTPQHFMTVLGVLHEAGVRLKGVEATVYTGTKPVPEKFDADDFRRRGDAAAPVL